MHIILFCFQVAKLNKFRQIADGNIPFLQKLRKRIQRLHRAFVHRLGSLIEMIIFMQKIRS